MEQSKPTANHSEPPQPPEKNFNDLKKAPDDVVGANRNASMRSHNDFDTIRFFFVCLVEASYRQITIVMGDHTEIPGA
jgi:hypothetical protein